MVGRGTVAQKTSKGAGVDLKGLKEPASSHGRETGTGRRGFIERCLVMAGEGVSCGPGTAMRYLDDTSPARPRAGASRTSCRQHKTRVVSKTPGSSSTPTSTALKVTEDVLPRWVGRLAAADVFTRSHAWEVVERLRIDA